MREGNGAAAIELGHDRLERRIAQPLVAIAGEQRDAVRLELVEPVFDLAQARLDMRQRHRHERPEPTRMVGRKLRRIVVGIPRKAAALLVIADPHARRRHRRDGGGDGGAVHVLERALRRPVERRRLQARAHLLDEERGDDVVMDIDAVWLRHGVC